MKHLHRISLAVMAAGLVAAVPMVTTAQDVAGKKVCYAFQDLSTGFWVASHDAIVSTLEENGVEVLEYNGGKDANRQLEQINDCIAQGADGIILTADDSDSETTLVALAQENDVPIATFNRPPSDLSKGIIVVADNESVARVAVEAMADEAEKKFAETGEKLHPLILVGDLKDANAVKRREGFINALANHADIFETPVEIATEWNTEKALAGLEAAVTADPDIDFIFTSSDFLFPTIQSVLDAHGKWHKAGEDGHVILGGLDGDDGACRLIREGYVDSTGVQDVKLESQMALDGIIGAIASGETQPNSMNLDPGFALSQANLAEMGPKTWGCQVLDAQGSASASATAAP
jgi:inositol transport system substrate-binding protein